MGREKTGPGGSRECSMYPNAVMVCLVVDNLNTNCLASLYETFEPKEARRLAERLEIHYTPKHGSWPNMAEVELSALKWTVPGSTHSRPGNIAKPYHRMGKRQKQPASQDPMAIFYYRCSNKTETPLSEITAVRLIFE